MYGGAGDDTIYADAEEGLYDGDADSDLVVFRIGATGGIGLDLKVTDPQTVGGGFRTKTLIDIGGVEGTEFDDVLVGNAEGSLLRGLEGFDIPEGGNGDDVLRGDLGGDRLLPGRGRAQVFGGPGTDRVSYEDISRGVRVDLAITDFQNTRGAGTDRMWGSRICPAARATTR